MIRQSNGIQIRNGEEVVVADGKAEGDHRVISHAHFDHLKLNDGEKVICSETTSKLAEARSGNSVEFVDGNEKVELMPSGHILGSSAALVDGKKKVLYTGDVSTRDRLYMDGFDPVDADVLVMETTYGVPNYRFPSQEEIEKRFRDWLEENRETPLILFGYSLGKAQKIQKMLEKFSDREILAHSAVKKMNETVEEATELDFRARPYGENKELLDDNAVLVAPSRSSKADWVEKLVEKYGAKKAGFSGWAVDDSFRYRGGYDETFALSDHCDFDELVELVEKVDPEKVYTQHGFDEAFASHLKKELGINARALKNNQSSLADF